MCGRSYLETVVTKDRPCHKRISLLILTPLLGSLLDEKRLNNASNYCSGSAVAQPSLQRVPLSEVHTQADQLQSLVSEPQQQAEEQNEADITISAEAQPGLQLSEVHEQQLNDEVSAEELQAEL